MAKVVLVDNYDRETVADVLYVENVAMVEAEKIADEYNKGYPDDWCWFARAVEDSYVLCKGIEDFI